MSAPVDWTESHRPKSLADVVGNGPSLAALRKWADAWETGEPKKRAIILAGPPGTGKTSTALALANDMDWAVIELNASDGRNAAAVKKVATAGAVHQTFSNDGSFHTAGSHGGRKLIILDEADNLYERLGSDSGGASSDLSDRGGKVQIVKTIRESHQPIILIVNDLYALTKGSGSALKSLADTLKFTRVNKRSIAPALDRIAKKEGVTVDRIVLDALADRSGGDLRAAVRDFQSIAMGRTHVGPQALGSLGARDATATVFEVMKHVLKGTRLDDLRREVWTVDATPDDLVMWVDENMPKEYKDPEDLVRGYEALSRADRFLGRTRRTQNYGLWSYASELATGGVMLARQREYRGFPAIGFPRYISRMAQSRGARGMRTDLADKLGEAVHSSRRKIMSDQIHAFAAVFRNDREFAIGQTHALELPDDAVAFLLDANTSSKEVKEIRAAVKELDAKGTVTRRVAAAKAPKGLSGFPGSDEAPKKAAKPPAKPAAKPEKAPEPKKASKEAKPEPAKKPLAKKLESDESDEDAKPDKAAPGKGQARLF